MIGVKNLKFLKNIIIYYFIQTLVKYIAAIEEEYVRVQRTEHKLGRCDMAL